MKKNTFIVLRWIAVLPATTLVLAGVPALFYIIQYFSAEMLDESSDGLFLKYIVPVMGNLLAGYFSLKAGVYIAPTQKKNTSLVLLILIMLVLGYTLMHMLIVRDWVQFASTIGNIIGIAMAFIEAYNVKEYRYEVEVID